MLCGVLLPGKSSKRKKGNSKLHYITHTHQSPASMSVLQVGTVIGETQAAAARHQAEAAALQAELAAVKQAAEATQQTLRAEWQAERQAVQVSRALARRQPCH
jgi:hypothetical protein